MRYVLVRFRLVLGRLGWILIVMVGIAILARLGCLTSYESSLSFTSEVSEANFTK